MVHSFYLSKNIRKRQRYYIVVEKNISSLCFFSWKRLSYEFFFMMNLLNHLILSPFRFLTEHDEDLLRIHLHILFSFVFAVICFDRAARDAGLRYLGPISPVSLALPLQAKDGDDRRTGEECGKMG